MLVEKRDLLDELAHRLLEKEVVEGDDLRALIASHQPAQRAAG